MLRQAVSQNLKNSRIISSSLKQPSTLSKNPSTFNSTRFFQQEASRANKSSQTSSNPISSFFNRLFNTPKGFDKFFKDRKFNGQKGTPNNNSNNNPSGGGNPNLNKNSLVSLLISSILLGAATFYIEDQLDNTFKEVTFSEFNRNYLKPGHVTKIVIENEKVAKVYLKEDSLVQSSYSSPPTSTTITNDSSSGEYGWENSYESSTSSKPKEATPAIRIRKTEGEKHGKPGCKLLISNVDNFERKLEKSQEANGIHPDNFVDVSYVEKVNLGQEALKILPTLITIGVIVYLTKSMGGMSKGGPGSIFGQGKTTAKKINKESVNVTFKDVAGCDEAKREIIEFVDFLKDSKKFTDLGAKIPKGALLCGPPGTGKTLLAKATAGEANVPFYSVSGSEFLEMFVGVGPARVRDLFKEARANAPCIIFIDEIDAVGRQRGKGGFAGGNDERENTLNQMLVEMDGFDPLSNIVVLAGTNRVDILDKALTRAGRFDRQITVDKPDIKGRKDIFDIYLKNLTILGDTAQFSSRLAALTPGFVGADIANICNEAAIVAARRSKTKIDLDDFETAIDRVIGGLESNKIMSPEEKKIVAYHEAGHAVAGWFLQHADPLLKVTIVPRGNGALGYAQYLPKELYLRTQEQILDTVCMALAGRASEEINFGNVTTGASDDLRRVTQIFYQMVQVYGFNSKVGQLGFPQESGNYPNEKMYSEATAQIMDEEVREMVKEAYERTKNLMKEKHNEVKLVAELLLEKETITNSDVAKLIGPRAFSAGKEYDMFLKMGAGDVDVMKELDSEKKEEENKPKDDELKDDKKKE